MIQVIVYMPLFQSIYLSKMVPAVESKLSSLWGDVEHKLTIGFN